ncbi:hypothetical protein [Saprospira grandis]|uniref:hypothetical protein n=1 Tax=Saprospira grandis TaxID=1008 RepID=UPI0022DD5A9B|nr:hypothetical protein [Saprospira grandis]WBM75716.1 hypothetical protein OP864_05615 [Saprospira grandis]
MAKRNKKSFSTDLESLFEHTLYEDNAQDNPSVLTVEKEEKSSPKSKKKTGKKRKSSRKSFADNLESFFKESIESSFGKEGTSVAEVKRGVVQNKDGEKAVGIELLLRRTIPESPEEQETNGSRKAKQKTRRLTVVLNSKKIDQFKTIARQEKKPMRQILDKLIEAYIREQEELLEEEEKKSKK